MREIHQPRQPFPVGAIADLVMGLNGDDELAPGLRLPSVPRFFFQKVELPGIEIVAVDLFQAPDIAVVCIIAPVLAVRMVCTQW